jgi:hypothetical protein
LNDWSFANFKEKKVEKNGGNIMDEKIEGMVTYGVKFTYLIVPGLDEAGTALCRNGIFCLRS